MKNTIQVLIGIIVVICILSITAIQIAQYKIKKQEQQLNEIQTLDEISQRIDSVTKCNLSTEKSAELIDFIIKSSTNISQSNCVVEIYIGIDLVLTNIYQPTFNLTLTNSEQTIRYRSL